MKAVFETLEYLGIFSVAILAFLFLFLYMSVWVSNFFDERINNPGDSEKKKYMTVTSMFVGPILIWVLSVLLFSGWFSKGILLGLVVFLIVFTFSLLAEEADISG